MKDGRSNPPVVSNTRRMDRWLPTVALLAGACGFKATVTPNGQVADAAIDGPPLVVDGVAHVATADEAVGDADLTISSAISIDTDALTLGITLPAGVTFAMAPQDGGGPDLAILHVRTLDVEAPVTAHGSRPLVVIADTILVSKDIDVGAHLGAAGPGAQTSGPGVGGLGVHVAPYTDSGGGGGGYSSAGGVGGDVTCVGTGCPASGVVSGGAAGAGYNGSAAMLIGGSSGGRPFEPSSSACIRAPGGGGGAIELYARTRISVAANINAGGGGGAGGIGTISSSCGNNYLAGYGGGSGGAIVLQSPVIDISGRVSANGGGGGGGGGEAAGLRVDGGAGADGASGSTVASGGTAPIIYGSVGGPGGAGNTGPGGGARAPASGNGGGGGGAYGQIVLLYQTTPAVTGVISPIAIMKNY